MNRETKIRMVTDVLSTIVQTRRQRRTAVDVLPEKKKCPGRILYKKINFIRKYEIKSS